MLYLTCAEIGLGGRGVINTWINVAARASLYLLTSDLTSLVPLQFSYWLQVRKVGIAYFVNFLFTIGAAQVRYVTEIRTKITDLVCEQKLCPKWLSCRRKISGTIRGTQRQFSENICWEDDLRSRIFGTFVVKFLACLPLLGFSNI